MQCLSENFSPYWTENILIEDFTARASGDEQLADTQSGTEGAEQVESFTTDNQGNPIDSNGRLVVEEISSIDELTDDDFTNPYRSVQLPKIPDNVDNVIGANGRPVIIKKNIFEKNRRSHTFTPSESRTILNNALYNSDIVGRTNPSKKVNNWVAIKIDDKSPITVLEVNRNKENIEVIGWYTLDKRNLERIERQAKREGGELLILTPKGAAASLSTLPLDSSSTSKGTNSSGEYNTPSQERISGVAPKVKTKLNLYNYVWKKSANPEFKGVYHDKGLQVATDTHLLVALELPYPSEFEGVVTDRKGNTLSNRYPDWRQIPGLNTKSEDTGINLDDLAAFVEGVKSILEERFPGLEHKIERDFAPIKLLDHNGQGVYYSVETLDKFLQAARHIGGPLQIAQVNKKNFNIICRNGENVAVLINLQANGKHYFDYASGKEIGTQGEGTRFSIGGKEKAPETADNETYSIKDRVERLFNDAIAGNITGKSISIGRLTEAGKRYLENISGLKFKDVVDFYLNPSDLVHIFNNHYGENEKDTGNNIPLNIEDIRNIVDVINKPTHIIYLGDNNGKRFAFLKQTESGTHNLLEVYSSKRGNLSAKTLYKTKKDASHRAMILKKESQNSTSLTNGAILSSANIPILFEGYNNKIKDTSFSVTSAQDAENITASEELVNSESGVRYSIVTDKAELDRLNSEPTVKAYRAMQLKDGVLYPPMAAKVNGKWNGGIPVQELGTLWEQSEEHSELADDRGYFKLDKGNGKNLKARYNPYIHTSLAPLNDQFSSAQDRPELVVVEVEVPESELTSGYKAEKAKDAVGKVEWKAGVIQSKLSGTRTVILTRWDKPVKIVPDSEVADVIVNMFDGKDITMPSNVVTPSLRTELESRGIPFVETNNQGKPIGEVGSSTSEDLGVRFHMLDIPTDARKEMDDIRFSGKEVAESIQVIEDIRQRRIGQSLTQDEARLFVSALEIVSDRAPKEVDYNRESFDALFAKWIVTPEGKVKMGEGQFRKFEDLHRTYQLAYAYETLRNPDFITHKKSYAKDGQTAQRDYSKIYGKVFTIPLRDAESKVYYNSISVLIDGSEIIISNYAPKSVERFIRELKEGSLTYIKKVTLPSESGTSAQGDQRTTDTGTSFGSKDTNSSDNSNASGERFRVTESDAPSFRAVPVERNKELVAVHNLNEQDLRNAFELGGFPMPSIAITKADVGHTTFGDISGHQQTSGSRFLLNG